MTAKKALILGATGLVGGCLLRILLEDMYYAEVSCLLRRPLPLKHPRLRQHVIDFEEISKFQRLLGADDVFCCLGTTMKKARTKENFYRVDYHYPVVAAEKACDAGARQYLIISALGADRNSRFFYNRVKGDVEEAVATLPFEAVHIFRPSLLLGERSDARLAEAIGNRVSSLLSFIWRGPLRPYAPIQAEAVAYAMMKAARMGLRGVRLFTSDDIRRLFRERP